MCAPKRPITSNRRCPAEASRNIRLYQANRANQRIAAPNSRALESLQTAIHDRSNSFSRATVPACARPSIRRKGRPTMAGCPRGMRRGCSASLLSAFGNSRQRAGFRRSGRREVFVCFGRPTSKRSPSGTRSGAARGPRRHSKAAEAAPESHSGRGRGCGAGREQRQCRRMRAPESSRRCAVMRRPVEH